jgi:hypothetical protein
MKNCFVQNIMLIYKVKKGEKWKSVRYLVPRASQKRSFNRICVVFCHCLRFNHLKINGKKFMTKTHSTSVSCNRLLIFALVCRYSISMTLCKKLLTKMWYSSREIIIQKSINFGRSALILLGPLYIIVLKRLRH